MNKRGLVRILEAVIAIMLVIGVLFVFFNRDKIVDNADYSERSREILKEMSEDAPLREIVVNYNETSGEPIPSEIQDFVSNRIKEDFLSFEVRVCEVGSVCGKSEFVDAEVFSAERTISSTIETYSPKKVRIFIWANQ